MTITKCNRAESNGVTQDYFFKKKVSILQRKKGYRFSVDAPILVHFLPSLPREEALEIGTGCGVISLLALYKKKFANITGIEIQESLFKLALINAEKNGFLQHFKPIHGDFRENYMDFAGVQTIFSNPPFFDPRKGRLSPNEEIKIAKTEINLTLKDLLQKSRSILGKNGSLYLILPCYRFDDLMALAKDTKFFPHRTRDVLSFNDGKPERFLVQLTTNKLSLEIMEPLIIFKEKGIYTEEMDKILTG